MVDLRLGEECATDGAMKFDVIGAYGHAREEAPRKDLSMHHMIKPNPIPQLRRNPCTERTAILKAAAAC